MLFKDDKYIVKAKDLDVEIDHSINDTLGNSLDIKITWSMVIATFFILLIMMVILGIDIINIIIFLGIYVITEVWIMLESKWKLKIENRTVYIDTPMLHHKVIDYSNLVSLSYWQSCGKYKRKYFTISYLNNNKINHINLSFANKYESEIKEICNSFITNKDIEKGIQPEYGYFDVRDEDLNRIISKSKNEDPSLILMIIFCVFMIVLIGVTIIIMFKR